MKGRVNYIKGPKLPKFAQITMIAYLKAFLKEK